MNAKVQIRTVRFLFLLAIPVSLAAGCKIKPGEGQFICNPDVAGSCPPGWVCQMRGTAGEYRCYSSTGAFCGNGQLDPGEQCDATDFGDGCSTGHPVCDECRLTCTECGNRTVEQADDGYAEECDCGTDATDFPAACVGPNGTQLPGACRLNCTQARCGGDATDLWEQCDDGNTVSGDGCSSDCLSTEVCGNAFGDFALGELCDDGNVRSADGCSSQCQPELPVWVQWHSRFGRTGFGMAYNPDRGTTMIFSGWDGYDMLNDLWEYDGLHWFEIEATPAPVGRMGHSMAYDTARSRLVIFGGFDSFGLRRDTWEFDGNQWVETTLPQIFLNPPAREHAAMAYDGVRGVMVLFGGTENPLPFEAPLNDTWEYDGTQWQNVGPAPSPAPRYGAAMTYDAARSRMVLFGGADENGRMFDTWEYDGTQWQPVFTAISPSPRMLSAMTFDSSRNRVVLFGGGGGGDHFFDTWEYDGSDWLPVDLNQGERPTERIAARMVFDTQRARSVLFGGEMQTDILSDTWEYNGVRWIVTTPPMSPTPRWGQAMAYDPRRQQVVLFGGHELTTANYRSDTWEFDGESWIEVLSTHDASPPARAHAAMAYDPVRQRVVLFGGEDATQVPFSDTWEYDGVAWTQVSFTAGIPDARAFHSMVYDRRASAVLLYGGRDQNGDFLGDTWLYDGTTWTEDHPAGSPGARRSVGLVFDIARRKVVLFGGAARSPIAKLYDTWEYQYDPGQSQWVETTPPWVSPLPRTYHAMAYDASRSRAMLFGGAGDQPGSLGDTWEYDGYQWRRVFPIAVPPPREGHTMVYDSSRKRTVLFGGTPTYNETWEYAFINVSAREHCSNGLDDDGDNLADCADPDCNLHPTCPVEICDNNEDDDADGNTDCGDPNCGGQPCGAPGHVCVVNECRCPGSGEESVCDDGLDNDCDGTIDCNDPDCATSNCCSGGGLCQPLTCLQCGDAIFGTNAGAPMEMTDYGCPVRPKIGSEVEYRFYATTIVEVTVRLTRVNADLDLIVLGSDGSGACDPTGQCIAATQVSLDDEVTFVTEIGRTYFFVVDGYQEAESEFLLQVECN